MADTPPTDLYLNQFLVENVEWGIHPEEVLGGTGRCRLKFHDKYFEYEPVAHWDVKVVIHSTGWVLFRGEIVKNGVHLRVRNGRRIWELDCADYNNELPQRLVGALDGKTWVDAGFGFFNNIDPYAAPL